MIRVGSLLLSFPVHVFAPFYPEAGTIKRAGAAVDGAR
jgi:hypothetical protein